MTKLFSSKQIKQWDQYTIENEPISSINLMERAANTFVNWFIKTHNNSNSVHIFCGPGNNGGDGLAIGRLLQNLSFTVYYYLVNSKNKLSTDCKINLNRVQHPIFYLNSSKDLNKIHITKNDIIIDGLFGSGLSRPLSGFYKELVQILNSFENRKIAIDIPSGMHCDTLNDSNDIIFKSDKIVSFQIPKRAFFFKENKPYFSSYTVLNIGLSNKYYKNTKSDWVLINGEIINPKEYL